MEESKKQVGRPKGDSQSRQKLIEAARSLFVEQDYSQVTVRDIASLAGTDAGLIRYYFGSKDRLFSAMLTETAQPLFEQMKQVKDNIQPNSPAELMQTYYQIMANHPHFPRLMFKLAHLDQDAPENRELVGAFKQIVSSGPVKLFASLKQQGALLDDVDEDCAQLSFFSMMIFPFLAPEMLYQQLGIKLTPEFLQKLAKQNANLLQRGLMTPEDKIDE